MSHRGCPMDDSAASKVKTGSRQVRVEELAAFAGVFGVRVEALLQPLELALSEELNGLLEELNERREDLLCATTAVVPVVQRAAAVAAEAGQPLMSTVEAATRQEKAMLHLVDVLLETEAAIRGDDAADYPRQHRASLLIRHGESVKVVQARLRHATAAETLDTYSHLWPDSEDRTRQAIDAGAPADVVRTHRPPNSKAAGQSVYGGRAGL